MHIAAAKVEYIDPRKPISVSIYDVFFLILLHCTTNNLLGTKCCFVWCTTNK